MLRFVFHDFNEVSNYRPFANIITSDYQLKTHEFKVFLICKQRL